MQPKNYRLIDKRGALLLGIALATVVASGFLFSQRFSPPGPLRWSWKFQDYEALIYFADSEPLDPIRQLVQKLPNPVSSRIERWRNRRPWAAIEIRRAGRRLYWRYGNSFDVLENWSGRDVTGKGFPNICILRDPFRNGGGRLDVFECGKKFQQIASIESLDFGPELQDVDNDGRPEVVVNDGAFYHWPLCRDGEPMPKVILRWHNGKYVPAGALMRKPGLSTSDLAAKAASIRTNADWSSEDNFMPMEAVPILFDLFYSGQEKEAWRFFDDMWKPGADCKNEWAEGWRGRLQDSDYWPQLRDSWNNEH